MQKILWGLTGLIIAALAVVAGVLAFDPPVKPPPLASTSNPFADVDFSGLPALRDAGASVYVPALRGHRNSGRSGDIDYIGQLEDDLADFIAVLRPLHRDAGFSLIGFSSGGGFVLRVIAARDEELLDRFIMISPALPPGAPTIRPGARSGAAVALPRIIVLATLNRVGIDWLNGLPIVTFATSPDAADLTSVYSFALTAPATG
jgi:alpha-beta hydrolase superfamily lysophospholipase